MTEIVRAAEKYGWAIQERDPRLSGMPLSRQWNPTKVTSAALYLWLDATFGTYQDTGATTPAVADSDPVALWQDRSGRGNHFSIGVAGQRPLLRLGISPTGLPAVVFDGTDDVLDCANNFILNWVAGHIFSRLKVAADPPPGAPNVGAIYRFATATTETDYPFTDSKIYGGFLNASAWVPTLGYDHPTTLTSYHTLEEYKTGGNGTIVMDGSVITTEAKADGGASNVTPRLGSQNNATIYGAPSFTRILVYNAPLSAIDAAAVRTYLNV